MTFRSAIAAACLTASLFAASAQAQNLGDPYRQPPPLYPYATATQPYAVEVAPNTYVIHRPAARRAEPYVACTHCGRKHVADSKKAKQEKMLARASARIIDADHAGGEITVETPDSIPADGKQRVIHADAEITILGPDRMSIRLIRKPVLQSKARPNG